MESRDTLPLMNEQSDLSYMANLYMALADKTRLRLLNLMRDQEVCVGYFTDVLGDSQPKISRHLAYLRNAGVVETRRDGKWIYYRIKRPDNVGLAGIVDATLRSLAVQEICRLDSEKYDDAFGSSMAITSDPTQDLDIYAYADTYEQVDEQADTRSSHNDLEEFLL